MDKDFSCSPAAVKAYMNLSIDESRWLYATLSSTTNQINKEALHNIEVLILVLYFFLFRQYKKTKSVTSLHAPQKNGSKYLHENYPLYPWLRWFVRSVKKIVFDWTVKLGREIGHISDNRFGQWKICPISRYPLVTIDDWAKSPNNLF